MAEHSRQGLDRLLAVHPEAEVAWVENQRVDIAQAQGRGQPIGFYGATPIPPVNPGPWTCVDLYEGGEILRFAIWNLTGQVYALDENGAVGDDPVY